MATVSDDKVQDDAFEWVKQHKKDLFLEFADPTFYPLDPYPTTVFMAGSPGAGKQNFQEDWQNNLNRSQLLSMQTRFGK